MERQINKDDKLVHRLGIIFILVFHAVGLVGFLLPTWHPYFLKLVPFHLLLMFLIIIFTYHHKFKPLFYFILGTFLCGYLVEVLGVKSGLIFGGYYYGNTLGIQLFSVPLLIGINWVILIYSVGQMMRQFKIRNTTVAALIGGLFMIGIDYFIEPVAMKLNFWQWDWKEIPLQNFISWYIVSVILLKFYFAMQLKLQKHVGLVMYFTQLVFFMLLYKFL